MTQLQVLTDGSTTKIKVTILHANIITTIGIVLNSKRRCQTLTQHIQFLNKDLDIARRHLRILGLALTDFTSDLNTKLTAKLIGTLTQISIRSLIEY